MAEKGFKKPKLKVVEGQAQESPPDVVVGLKTARLIGRQTERQPSVKKKDRG